MRRVVVWDVGGTLACRGMTDEEFLGRCLASAGISVDSLNPSAARAARELRRRQEPMWRTAADEEAGCLEIAATLLRGSGATEEQVRDVAKALVNYFGLFALEHRSREAAWHGSDSLRRRRPLSERGRPRYRAAAGPPVARARVGGAHQLPAMVTLTVKRVSGLSGANSLPAPP